jgi:hypothetical protein
MKYWSGKFVAVAGCYGPTSCRNWWTGIVRVVYPAEQTALIKRGSGWRAVNQ